MIIPQYNYYCEHCNREFTDIVKMDQEYTKCRYCGHISKRTHCDLPNEQQMDVGVGGITKGRFRERKF